MQDTSFYCLRCINIVAYPVKKINISFLKIVKFGYFFGFPFCHRCNLVKTLSSICNVINENIMKQIEDM